MSYKDKKEPVNQVNEPLVAYLRAPNEGSSFMSILSGAKFNSKSASDWDILKLTREGLPKRVLMLMAKKISLTLQELSNVMHISERTLQRYDDDEVVKTEYAEKAINLARLYTRGEEVFGSLEKFKTWMRTPLYVFHGETPVSLLDTSVGFDIIFTELGRIEHGIFA